ncbi:hypothetical protein EG68_10832 [Paragonimus skrjabini miyazakii]|uniref:Uncharacterized protein n=1 Tax=Paragonimus skrjabini miyazakii TaxID=59628 RepID=A0A8S9YGQ7_9TREM|nr:hypothetical protein EG68_10832 [Paragonimus skrjabini miyazakii]
MPSKVTKWLAAYKPSSSDAIDELASWMYTHVKLLEEIEEVLEKLSSTLIPEVCQRLHAFYKAKSHSLRRFAIFLLPSLLYTYLSHFCEDDATLLLKKTTSNPGDVQQNAIITNLASLESCLIGMSRHFELFNPHHPQYPNSAAYFCLPTLSESSIFNDPVPKPESKTDSGDGVFPTLMLPANYNRIPAITHLIRDYLDTLTSIDLLDTLYTFLSLHSMTRFCKLCDRVASLSKRPRIPACPSLLSDLLVGLDIILYKLDDLDKRTETVRRTSLIIRSSVWSAVKEIEKRAAYNCLSGPLLVCRAILHSRAAGYGPRAVPGARIGGGSGAFVDIGSLLISAEDHTTVPNGTENSKSTDVVRGIRPHHSVGPEVITNASFRPETLPEDIPISGQQTPGHGHNANASGKNSRSDKSASDSGRLFAADSRTRANSHRKDQAKSIKLVNVNAKRVGVE